MNGRSQQTGIDTMQNGAGNLFDGIAGTAQDEQISQILSTPAVRIERIVSTGQASPPDFWYDQDRDEWVMVLAGAALLRFENQPEPYRMRAGDYRLIPRHCRHRVEWTDPAVATIWLAIHIGPE